MVAFTKLNLKIAVHLQQIVTPVKYVIVNCDRMENSMNNQFYLAINFKQTETMCTQNQSNERNYLFLNFHFVRLLARKNKIAVTMGETHLGHRSCPNRHLTVRAHQYTRTLRARSSRATYIENVKFSCTIRRSKILVHNRLACWQRPDVFLLL